MDKQQRRERLTAKANDFLSTLSDNIDESRWHLDSTTKISINTEKVEKSYISVKFTISKQLVREIDEIPGQQKIDIIGGN
jgi:hypothetical protein